MTTTAVRTSCTALRRDGDVMRERFRIHPCRGGAPRDEDALKVGVMRRIAAARLRYHGLGGVLDETTLIVSELLTNALLHSGTDEIGLTITRQDGMLRIEVRDGMPGRATPGAAVNGAESGRGLPLVDALVTERGGAWGTADAGAVTWCQLTVPDAGTLP